MINKASVDDLNRYVVQWEKDLASVTEVRDRLMRDKKMGLTLVDEDGVDLLSERINGVDQSVIEHQEIVIRMRALRDREINGGNE